MSKARVLHERAMKLANTLITSERELVEVLRELDVIKGFYDYGATSLFDYAHRILGLAEHTAYDIINVARKSREVPELGTAVAAGEISVTKARRISAVITPENKNEWIELAKTTSKSQLERAIKTEHPEFAVTDSARFVTGDQMEVKCGLSAEAFDKLRRVMDLESQRTRSASGQGHAIEAALDAYLEKHDPLLKAERAADRRIRKQATIESGARLGPGQVDRKKIERVMSKRGGRELIPAALDHAVQLRDGARCTHVDPYGKRCPNRRWLETHHIIAIEEGGANEIDNLTTLCSGHHRLIHRLKRRRERPFPTVEERQALYH